MVAERHDVMADYIQPVELSGEEQNVLSAVYENAVGSRRAAWRRVTIVEHEGETKGNEQQAAHVREYFVKAEAELPEIHDGILTLMDKNRIPSASTGEPKVFYYKTNGEYFRFLAGCATGDPKSKVAQDAVDEPVVLQMQAPMIQKVLKTVEFPRVQCADEIVDVLVVAQCRVPISQIVEKTVEVPQVQSPDRVFDIPVVTQKIIEVEKLNEVSTF